MDSKVTSGYGQGQDFESTKSFKFFTVFFPYGKNLTIMKYMFMVF